MIYRSRLLRHREPCALDRRYSITPLRSLRGNSDRGTVSSRGIRKKFRCTSRARCFIRSWALELHKSEILISAGSPSPGSTPSRQVDLNNS